MSLIKFGTDGWRAIMDKEFTLENVEKVAQAFCDYVKQEFVKQNKVQAPKIVVGYDYRKNSDTFAAAVSRVLVANGIEVLMTDNACPTPAVSYTIVSQKYDAGIAITASHNPAAYNGFKIKTHLGSSAEKTFTDGVESFIGKNPVKSQAFNPANPVIKNLNNAYLDYLKKYLNLDLIKKAPFSILVDSMHGVGAKYIEQMLAGGNIKVTTTRSERDTNFGGIAPEPIPGYLSHSMEMMKSGLYDLCIVTDGDADRVAAIRPGGEFISPGIILSLILIHFVEDLKKTGSVVTTISNTGLIYKVAKKHGLKVHETPVGFKYVCEIMQRENVLIGGEESGGIGFQDYLYERDGMLSGLLLVQMMAYRKMNFEQTLQQVEKEYGKLYYIRKDMEYPNELKSRLFEHLKSHQPANLSGQKVVDMKSFDGVKYILQDGSWLLFRLSGTEPILRVYSEATSLDLAQSLVSQGKEIALNVPKN